MDWKKFSSLKHHNLSTHHHYQFSVIFLFIFGFFLFFPYYLLMQEFNLNIHLWQWFFFVPWMIFYIYYSLKQRSKIPPQEQKNPLVRPIGHWVLLGLSIVFLMYQPSDLRDMDSINIAFIILSLFVADGYWDYRNLKF
jgi:hypothetical protein